MSKCKKCGGTCGRCSTCGGWECDHHEYIPVTAPHGCVCDPLEWRGQTIPPSCGNYEDDGHGQCKTCEHDWECHE
jgi:hypothetical protein